MIPTARRGSPSSFTTRPDGFPQTRRLPSAGLFVAAKEKPSWRHEPRTPTPRLCRMAHDHRNRNGIRRSTAACPARIQRAPSPLWPRWVRRRNAAESPHPWRVPRHPRLHPFQPDLGLGLDIGKIQHLGCVRVAHHDRAKAEQARPDTAVSLNVVHCRTGVMQGHAMGCLRTQYCQP